MPSKEDLGRAYAQEDADDRCRAFLQVLQDDEWPGYDKVALKNIEFVSSSPGRVEYAFTVEQPQCNSLGSLHGGCAATILDSLTSAVVLTEQMDSEYSTSVSRTLSCTYLKALPKGERCTVVAEMARGGRQLLHIRGEIRGSDGRPAVVCAHDKARIPTPKL